MQQFIRIAFCFLSTIITMMASSSSFTFAQNVPAMFVFGDSLLDAGTNHFNKNCSTQADFPPYGSNFFHHPTGRFTNGRIVADFISQYVGLDMQKPFLEAQIAVNNGSSRSYPKNGLNFASAGSGVLPGTNQESGVTPIQRQVQQMKMAVEGNLVNKTLVKKSLFLFESGSNDIFSYFTPGPAPPPSPEAHVQAMLGQVANFAAQIYKVGARRVAFFAVGPIGCVPARVSLGAPADRCFGRMNAMVQMYNKGLESLVKEMPAKHPGTIAVFGAVYDIVQQFRANPARYGFANVTHACCGAGPLRGALQCGKEGFGICNNPDQFVFWDFFHPSQHVYKLVSEALWAGPKSRVRPINLRALAANAATTPTSHHL